jgi:hypothetical protein
MLRISELYKPTLGCGSRAPATDFNGQDFGKAGRGLPRDARDKM